MAAVTPAAVVAAPTVTNSLATHALTVIYSQHDVDLDSAEPVESSGESVNKPVVRKRRIIEALQKAASGKTGSGISFQPLTEPAASLKPAELVHAPKLVDLFDTGFARWEALGDAGRDLYFSTAGRVNPPDWSELVPSQSAPRDPYQRPGNSVHGACSFFAQDRSTPITRDTSKTLRHDMAVTLQAVESILSKAHSQVYACTTQPGHHSGPESYGGYCYVNNAAVAATMLQQKLGKVALLDTDIHNGNGSYAIFARSPDVFFASLHADPEIEYPFCCGWADQRGEGEGEGCSINVPLPKDTDWSTYKPELTRVLAAIKSFGAQAIVVSLGVDTLADDPECAPMAGFRLRGADYNDMGDMVRSLGLPTLWVQEGGYKLDEAGDVVRRVVAGDRTGEDQSK